jgi:hypothetical protein
MNHLFPASATVSGRSSAPPIRGFSLHRKLIITTRVCTHLQTMQGLDKHHGQETASLGPAQARQQAGKRQRPSGGEGQWPLGTWDSRSLLRRLPGWDKECDHLRLLSCWVFCLDIAEV